jgi:hypothetical protein
MRKSSSFETNVIVGGLALQSIRLNDARPGIHRSMGAIIGVKEDRPKVF